MRAHTVCYYSVTLLLDVTVDRAMYQPQWYNNYINIIIIGYKISTELSYSVIRGVAVNIISSKNLYD